MKQYIIVLDQGTTSTKIVLIDEKTEIIDKDYIEIKRKDLANGEVLQDSNEILLSAQNLIQRLFDRNNLNPKDVKAIGITNQRETTILFDKKTGKPIFDAISWQSRHTNYITEEWKDLGYQEEVFNKTGLLINPYFSASKIKYLLNKYKGNLKDVLFGTVDSFLIYNLTVEKNHYTDISNASRTMLFNINTLEYDQELLDKFAIPKSILPKVLDNDKLFGNYNYNGVNIPIYAVAGDQQSALFGHLCTSIGETKVTYGTGCFILTNVGNKACYSKNGLLTTIAWKLNNKISYALEGSVFMGGAAVAWMRDKLNLVDDVNETENMAYQSNNDNVFVVPAFVGLGAPYWNNDIRGSILGLEANTSKRDIMKATLNSIAYQVTDILNLMKNDTNVNIKSIAVDGGASNNNYLMQFQSDLINVNLIQNVESEITALGVGFMAGLSVGLWKDINEIKKLRKIKKMFVPNMDKTKTNHLYERWKKAVEVTKEF